MKSEELSDLIVAALEELKAENVSKLDVRSLTTITDYMIVASGRSDRHVRAIADNVLEKARDEGIRPYGVEGHNDGEWVLVDLEDALVHVMLPRVRDFYQLEKLWDLAAPRETIATES